MVRVLKKKHNDTYFDIIPKPEKKEKNYKKQIKEWWEEK